MTEEEIIEDINSHPDWRRGYAKQIYDLVKTELNQEFIRRRTAIISALKGVYWPGVVSIHCINRL